jgi:hypothetical protein
MQGPGAKKFSGRLDRSINELERAYTDRSAGTNGSAWADHSIRTGEEASGQRTAKAVRAKTAHQAAKDAPRGVSQ